MWHNNFLSASWWNECLYHAEVLKKENKSAHLNKIPFIDLQLVWKADRAFGLQRLFSVFHFVHFFELYNLALWCCFLLHPRQKCFSWKWGGEKKRHIGVHKSVCMGPEKCFSSHNLFQAERRSISLTFDIKLFETKMALSQPLQKNASEERIRKNVCDNQSKQWPH